MQLWCFPSSFHLTALGYFEFVSLTKLQAVRILEVRKDGKVLSCWNSECSGKETAINPVGLKFTFHWGKRWPQVVQMMEKDLVTCGTRGHRGPHSLSIQTASNTLWWVGFFEELKFIKKLMITKNYRFTRAQAEKDYINMSNIASKNSTGQQMLLYCSQYSVITHSEHFKNLQ